MAAKSTRSDDRTTKAILDNAANLLDVNLDAFLLDAAMSRTQEIRDQSQPLHLTSKEALHFVSTLENPPHPTKALKQLFKTYRTQNK